jgi:hypothetical protein
MIEKLGWESSDICNMKGTPTCARGLEMTYWGRDGKYLKYRWSGGSWESAKCPSRFKCTASRYGYVLKLPVMKEDLRPHLPIPSDQEMGKIIPDV